LSQGFLETKEGNEKGGGLSEEKRERLFSHGERSQEENSKIFELKIEIP